MNGTIVSGLKASACLLLCLAQEYQVHQSGQCARCAWLQISGVVGEQELGLRQMLRTMGMLDSAYWLSWMLFEVQLCLCHISQTFSCCCSALLAAEEVALLLIFS